MSANRALAALGVCRSHRNAVTRRRKNLAQLRSLHFLRDREFLQNQPE
jgi:hypothetical protein